MVFEPAHDFLAVIPIVEETTPGGIIVPKTVEGTICIGDVKAAGPGRVEYGCIVQTTVRRNMKIVYPAGKYPEVTDTDGTKYILVRETQILGRFPD